MSIAAGAFLVFFQCFLVHAQTQPQAPRTENSVQTIDTNKFSELIQIDVERYLLPNGLTVLLHEDHSSPIVSVHQWFRVGSRNEVTGKTGLAHFFEHLMFKGTAKYPPSGYDKVIRLNGGVVNAFTNRDYTGYYTNIPSSKFEFVLDVESDRMRGLLFDQKAIDAEREVVKEEKRVRVDNSVMGILQEEIYKSVYKVHPYRWPIIGSMVDLNNAVIDDFKQFYKAHYAPNNAVLVVAGDIKKSKAKELILKYYGAIPATMPLPTYAPPAEPEQKAQRYVSINKDVQAPTVALSYMGVAGAADDSYALDLMANILGAGTSSRLHKRLVYKEQLSTTSTAVSQNMAESGIISVYTFLRPGIGIERVMGSLSREIEKMRRELVSDKELEKSKNQVMLESVMKLQTVYGKASALAYYETVLGDYKILFKDFQKYMNVTKEDILRVSKKYLDPQRRSMVQVLPKS